MNLAKPIDLLAFLKELNRARRDRSGFLVFGVKEPADTDEQPTSPTLGERCKGRLDVTIAADFDNDECLSDRVRRGLHNSSLSLGVRGVRVHEHRNRGRLGYKLEQQLKPLGSYRANEKAHACRVAARSVEAGDEATDDHVVAGPEHDWYRRGCSLGGECRRSISDD